MTVLTCYDKCADDDGDPKTGKLPWGESWWSWKTITKVGTGFFRFMILFIMAGSTFFAFYYLVHDFHCILGFNIALVFHFSFRFGLVGWASFLRFFLAWLTFLEIPLAILIE